MKTFALLALSVPLVVLPALAQPGAQQFASRCSGCHGADGNGGEHGPGIVELRRSRARTEAALIELIRNGLTEDGMPPFPLAEPELRALAAYVLSLRTP